VVIEDFNSERKCLILVKGISKIIVLHILYHSKPLQKITYPDKIIENLREELFTKMWLLK
jgi:hypothetical protein